MTRGILIALLLAPALVVAGPKKKPKKKKPPPAAEKEKEKEAEPKKEDADKPDPPASATTTTPTTPTTKSGTTPTAAPTTPATTPPGGAGSAAPPPKEGEKPPDKKDDPPPKEAKEVDVDALRQEYLSLRDELFKSRARANAVASQLYSTRVTIKFNWGSARHYGVSKASIRLDGATVYEDSKGAIAADDGVRFTGYVAPGRHLITFHVEATGKDDDSFTSATETQIVVKAVPNKDLLVTAKGRDSGDIAYEWKKSEKGSYGLGIDVGVKTVAQGGKK